MPEAPSERAMGPSTELDPPPFAGRQDWEAGDFSLVATGQTIVGELLCEAIGLRVGERVLDVATGSGNVALAAARRGAKTVGVDFVRPLLVRARERANAERVAIELAQGDGLRLPFRPGRFDVVLSSFGVMFVPEPRRAAAELLRVVRSGGRLGLTSWTPDGYVGEMFGLLAKARRDASAATPALEWGTEAGLRSLFGTGVAIDAHRRSVTLRGESPEKMVGGFRRNFGPAVNAFAGSDEAGRSRLEAELLALARRHNRSGDSSVMIPADFLEATIRPGS